MLCQDKKLSWFGNMSSCQAASRLVLAIFSYGEIKAAHLAKPNSYVKFSNDKLHHMITVHLREIMVNWLWSATPVCAVAILNEKKKTKTRTSNSMTLAIFMRGKASVLVLQVLATQACGIKLAFSMCLLQCTDEAHKSRNSGSPVCRLNSWTNWELFFENTNLCCFNCPPPPPPHNAHKISNCMGGGGHFVNQQGAAS